MRGAWAPGMTCVLCGNSLKGIEEGGNGSVLMGSSDSLGGMRPEYAQTHTSPAYAHRRESSLGHETITPHGLVSVILITPGLGCLQCEKIKTLRVK